MNRRGVALVAVLWAVTLLAGVVGAGTVAVRLGLGAARNRAALARGRWAAEACLAIARGRWAAGRLTDTATIDLGETVRCRWRVDDPSARVNLNTAPVDLLARLFRAGGLPGDSSVLLAEAAARRRAQAPFTHVEQFLDLPGSTAGLLPLVTVDGTGRVNVNAASPVVLAALPGFTPDVVARVVERRGRGEPPRSLDHLLALLSGEARREVTQHYAALAPLVAFERSHVVIVVEGWVGAVGSDPRATIEIAAALLPERLAVLRRRMR